MKNESRLALVLVLSSLAGLFLGSNAASAQTEPTGVTVEFVDAEPVLWQDPPPNPPTQPPTVQSPQIERFRPFDRRQGRRRTGRSLNQTQSRGVLASRNLQRAPDMFGDIFGLGGQILLAEQRGLSVFPLTLDSRRVKVGENNRALPDNRVFFLYNHFHNALEAGSILFPTPRTSPVDRYTFGIEHLIFNDLWSVEVRMPFTGTTMLDIPTGGAPLSVEGGRVGNLAVIVKHQIFRSDELAVALGMGIDLPTADDVRGMSQFTRTNYQYEAVHILPYIGFLCAPNDGWFFHGFAQVDLATAGNRIDVFDAFADVNLPSVIYNEQNLMYLDFAAGHWIYRNPGARFSGVAVTGELHYTTTLQDSDFIAVSAPSGTDLTFFNGFNRFDILNATIGLDVELGPLSNFRVAAVLPLRGEPGYRAFDAEVQVSATRRY